MFLKCDITGFNVDKRALPLIKANAVVSVVAFLLAITAALLVLFTRWQVVHLLPVDWYYRILTFHGLVALVVWIVFWEMAGLYFGSTVVLNARQVAPGVGWLAFVLMVVGTALVAYAVLTGQADVLFTSYTPLKAAPVHYLGIILFAVGALIVCGLFIANIIVAKKEKTYGDGPLPLFSFGLLTAVILAIGTLLAGAAIYVPTFLWSMGLIETVDSLMYRLVFWGFGHSAQQVNVAAQISIWYLGAFLVVGGTSINEKVSRTAFLFYLIGINLASAHHLLVDPIPSPSWKVVNTSYFMYLAVLASMIHAFAVPSAIEVAQRKRGFTKGLFDWIKNCPWENPAFVSIFLSIVMFGFIGGITGVINGMEQANMIIHNTLALPGHFKGTVVAGTTLTFMGATYYLIPLIFRKKISMYGVAKAVPWAFTLGLVLLSAGLSTLGYLGVPRRHWDITFSGGPFTYNFPQISDIFWVIAVIGGTILFLACLAWCLVVVVSVFFGQPVRGPQDMQLTMSGLPPEDPHGDHASRFVAPGTFTLTIVWMIAFLIFISLNWGWLSMMWEVK
ncbi:MAG: cbb3-type cytochrome c oxidase subunit I [Nitrospirae bacterium]|uniref:cbb3-type cytochrome c oxidase subunit I n=1 Tax=Candidatus Magnetobacterium casense TaxID=1455061 RepID=UPI000590DD04|nr:cbb3-type cytochrome c oxidase subunit I [Candidatus Magnetobacterium casensis]MBF0336337.1 cbb3-type cytochrome c oxidase subunit I [Nitrospirota bacterium]